MCSSPSPNWDATDYVMVGRRLLGQGDHVPPQTFMNLATVFLREGDVQAAMRTFNRAAEVLDYAEVLREAARRAGERPDRPEAGPAVLRNACWRPAPTTSPC